MDDASLGSQRPGVFGLLKAHWQLWWFQETLVADAQDWTTWEKACSYSKLSTLSILHITTNAPALARIAFGLILEITEAQERSSLLTDLSHPRLQGFRMNRISLLRTDFAAADSAARSITVERSGVALKNVEFLGLI